MRVAIQGLRGSFHSEAANQLLPNTTFDLVECMSFQDVFTSVTEGWSEYGVVAVENNIHGSINDVYRLLDRYSLWITGETTLHIDQYLIGHQRYELSMLDSPQTRVLSQAPALSQCEQWLSKNIPRAIRQETQDTAQSVRQIMADRQPGELAVAGKHAAKLYNATIIAGPINDDPHNYTRFFLLQKSQHEPSNANRTSIILKTDHAPGALYRALGVFADNNINLSKLDSHPITGDARHYMFYIDLDKKASTPLVKKAIVQLEAQGSTVRILGSYHIFTT